MTKILDNKQAFFHYHISSQLEAGLVLHGWEVKAIRNGRFSFTDSYITFSQGEPHLIGAHISPLKTSCTHQDYDVLRPRKLLMNRLEIARWRGMVEVSGFSCLPLSLYWSDNKIKMKIGLGKGKKLHDKRQSLKDKSVQRDTARELRNVS